VNNHSSFEQFWPGYHSPSFHQWNLELIASDGRCYDVLFLMDQHTLLVDNTKIMRLIGINHRRTNHDVTTFKEPPRFNHSFKPPPILKWAYGCLQYMISVQSQMLPQSSTNFTEVVLLSGVDRIHDITASKKWNIGLS
jgi:hypothetical protein